MGRPVRRLGMPLPRDQVLARWARPSPAGSRCSTRPSSRASRPASAPCVRPACRLQGAGGSTLEPLPREVPVLVPARWPPSPERRAKLVETLVSLAVRVEAPAAMEEVPAKLSADEVEEVFVSNVPGVKDFIFRGKAGEYCLKYIKMVYVSGLKAFQGTPLHEHLLWLLRLIVHHGHDNGLDAAKHLRDVAEAFQDCQAVQARVIERTGLLIRGVALNFQGLLGQLAGEYKTMALKILAYEEVVKLGGPDENNDPAHFENRLLMDIGELVGFGVADLRQAELDTHAKQRFPRRDESEQQRLVERFREVFDLEAMIPALVSELNSFSETSQPESLPRVFLDWASQNMSQKHIVFDEETCCKIEVEPALALAVVELVFLGKAGAEVNENYREEPMHSLFTGSC